MDLCVDVAWELFVHEGCAFLQCLDGIEDGGQDIVLNLYQLQRLVDSLLVYAGDGRDFVQVGQLYKSKRNAAAGVPNADVFATIETTRGYLSNGISASLAIYGDDDDDEFVVYHNLAPLLLFGGDGDDSFLIRAFALVGSQEDLRERTDVSGGAGADLIMYAVNAPVNIDGGDGFDTVIVIGTEFNDDFVVTENGVFGAGLNVTFTRIESVEVDGAEGDDRFFIRGTGAELITKVTGGLGSDTFFTNGATPDVISNDLLGHSGLITHQVSSTGVLDSEYAGIKVEGISANIADDDEPAIRIIESGGSSIVSQALGDIGAPEAVGPLTRALGDPVSRVREAAAEALGRAGTAAALPPLQRLVQRDPEHDVRAAARDAITKIRTRVQTRQRTR